MQNDLNKRFETMQRGAQADLAAAMGQPADFFATDPHAVDKMLAFMAKRGVITINTRPQRAECNCNTVLKPLTFPRRMRQKAIS